MAGKRIKSGLKETVHKYLFPKKKNPVSARKINFSYDKKKILRNFSFTARTSQIIAIVGRSGEGKSTFLNILSGSLTGGYSGKVAINGYGKVLAREDIGFVPQEISIVPDLSIEDNIVFFGSLYGLSRSRSIESGKELMKIMELDVPFSANPAELSGGQKVRLNIVVSFLHKPKVMILDEPFVGLDFYNRKLLWHFLEHQRNRRKTVVITTHMLTEAEIHSDRIVLLHRGRVFADGKLKDICKKLKTHFVLEMKMGSLNKRHKYDIANYCVEHNISLLDSFGSYKMFSVESAGQKNYFLKFLEKNDIKYEETGFREPTLDELFLKVKSV